jgi:serine/threonine protein kinase
VTLARGVLIAGRYEIEDVLGEGATGVVYRATQRPLGREVALKILRRDLATDPRALARFEREAKVASALEHPLAVAIYDFGQDGGSAFLAMELLHGAPLRTLLSERLPPSRALAIAYDVADILAAAHRIPLVHRDLKPENVFVEAENRARIVDFGLAFIAERNDSGRMTVEGVVAGTPSYLSPEQARGLEIGPPTDVYALGCMLFELVTGRVPFTGTEVEVLTRQLFAPPPSLRSVRDDVLVPAALEELLFSMLKKRAEERPTAARVRDSLALVDPDVAKSRGRARDDSFLLGREARMVEPVAANRPSDSTADGPLLAIARPVSPDLLVALAANGIVPYVVTPDEDLAGAAVVYLPDGTVAEVTSLAGEGHAIVTDTDAEDIDRIAALVRAGASEVVVKPVRPEDLARRVIRAAKKRERRGGK